MTGVALQYLTSGGRTLNRWSAIAIGLSIPVSIALDNVLLTVVLLTWLIGMQYRAKLMFARSNPVYRAGLLLFALLIIGTLYGNAAPGDAKLYLLKYLDLALIPLLGCAFITASGREQGLRALALGLALVLLISCAIKIGLIPPTQWLYGTPESPVVFKHRLTHNILMAFSFFLFAWLCCGAITSTAKIGWGSMSLLAVANTMLMVKGATGYIVLIGLSLLFGWQKFGIRGIAIATSSLLCLVTLLSLVPGPFQARIQIITQELHKERADRPASTSTGFRLEFYRNTLILIKKQPILGYGTGGFPAAYAELVKGSGQTLSRNPHNEFMLVTVHIGVFGLAALLWLLWQQWRFAPLLPTPLDRGLAQGLVVMTVIIAMLNSPLLDHTEGLLYAWLTALLYAGLQTAPAKEAAS